MKDQIAMRKILLMIEKIRARAHLDGVQYENEIKIKNKRDTEILLTLHLISRLLQSRETFIHKDLFSYVVLYY
jgi:hypothetical protein